MPEKSRPQPASITLKFGGGIHSRAPSDEIQDRECVSGQNFEMDLQDSTLRPRKPFDQVGITPNAAEIRGMASLLKTNGDVSMLVQAGGNVYEWDGTLGGFTLVGTVNSAAKLRGETWHNWQLGNKVLITDIGKAVPVKEWDGTTFQSVAFDDEDGNPFGGTGDMRAMYCAIENERAIFANIWDPNTSPPSSLPHMIVASKVSDYTNITVSNKPSSALGEDDPFYVLTPDLRYINGFLSAFETLIVSTIKGRFFKMAGSSAKDFAVYPLYPRSGASGDESVKWVGNDIYYGREGRIESLASNDKFGDVETDDISLDIFNDVEEYENWLLTYNQRTQRVYCYSQDTAELWVIYKPLVKSEISHWMRYKTTHSIAFNPTCMMTCYDPVDGMEYVFMGDSNGILYRMEGTLSAGDGGRSTFGSAKGNPIRVERLSKMVVLPQDVEAFNVEGWVRYRKLEAVTLEIRFEWQGHQLFTETITVELQASDESAYYGGGSYYGGGAYYGTNRRRFARERISVPGGTTEFQVRTIVTSTKDYAISEIGLEFKIAK